MKFPFVTRARHEAEIAEEKHAVNFQKQRRNYWKKRHSLLELEAERRKGEILELKENLRGVISQRDMASKNYQRIMEDHDQVLRDLKSLEILYADACAHRDRNAKNFIKFTNGMVILKNECDEKDKEISKLKIRLEPFLRKRGPQGKFVPAQPKESGQ